MILAVDPGQNTGVAFRLDNGNWFTLTVEKMPTADDRFDLTLSTLVEQFQKHTCTVLVIERFTSMSRYLSKFGIETIELVGAIRAICYVHGVHVALQMPGHRMGMVGEATKLLKERKRPYTDHEVSALAHLLAYETVTARRLVEQASA